jgi:hypothetical protein
MEKLSFENADIAKINRQLALETRFTPERQKQRDRGKQTSMSEFVK